MIEIKYIVLGIIVILTSTLWYLYMHKKTRINIKYVYTDNIVIILLAFGTLAAVLNYFSAFPSWLGYLISPFLVLGYSFLFTMYRFWRTPNRKLEARENEIICPADGNVIYIKEIPSGETPISIKNGLEAKLSEIMQTDILKGPCWLVGINMTPFDVHKNCTPVSGKILLNKHISGQFLSLKDPSAIVQNERNTLVIKNLDNELFGVVQTASKLVRRIDSYVKEGENVQQGKWFGMIRFGSQVDVIIPKHYKINVEVGQQTYAIKTVMAQK